MKLASLFVLTCVSMCAAAGDLKPVEYRVFGKPSSVAVTEDGKHLLLTEAGINGPKNSGIEVFSIDANGKLKSERTVSLGENVPQGIVILPHTQIVAVGASNAGVAIAPLADVLSGKAQFKAIPQGERAGSGYMAASADGQFLYVANEYGKLGGFAAGNVGVIALHRGENGALRPEMGAQVPSGGTTPGVAVSPDGKRVYSVAEVLPPRMADSAAGGRNKLLAHEGCKQNGDREMANGGLYIWDSAKLAELDRNAPPEASRKALVKLVAAGCSPVRIVVSADGKRLYTTARGDDRVLEFDTDKLEHAPDKSLIRALETGGTAPVGLALFAGDKKMLVANSNRFEGGTGTASVIDLESGKVMQTFKAGNFPRNIALSPDGKTLYLTEYLSGTLLVIPVE